MAGGCPQFAVDGRRLRLNGVPGQEQLGGYLWKRQVRGQHRQQPQLGSGQCRGSLSERTTGLRKLRSQVFGLRCEDAEPGAPRAHLLDLPQQSSRSSEVGQSQVTPRQLEPRLGGKVWQSIGQARPEPLRPGQFRAHPRLVALVQRQSRGRRVDDHDRRVVLELGLTNQGPGCGEMLFGLVPCVPGGRQQRTLGECDASVGRSPGSLGHGDGVVEEHIGAGRVASHQVRHT